MAFMITMPTGNRVQVNADAALIGRDQSCQIVLTEPGLHPIHAKIKKVAGRWLIEAQGDWMIQVGTGAPGRKSWLKPGDVIRLTLTGPEIIFDELMPLPDTHVPARTSVAPALPLPFSKSSELPAMEADYEKPTPARTPPSKRTVPERKAAREHGSQAESGNGAPSLNSVPLLTRVAESGELPPVAVGFAAALALPVGLYLILKHPRWTATVKGIWIGSSAAYWLLAFVLVPTVATILFLFAAGGMAFFIFMHEPHWNAMTKQGWLYASSALMVLACLIALPKGGGLPNGSTPDGSGGNPTRSGETASERGGSSSGVNTSSQYYKHGYKDGYDHGVLHARHLSTTYGGPGDGVYSDWEIDQDLELYDQPYLKDGPYNLKEPARTEWIQGFKDGERKGLGGYYKKPSR